MAAALWAVDWILDSDCGDRDQLVALGVSWDKKGRAKFRTANGVTSSEGVARMRFPLLGDVLEFHVMVDSPAVISLGSLANEGWEFRWVRPDSPILIRGSGTDQWIECQVKGDIPYLPRLRRDACRVAKLRNVRKNAG